MARPRIASDKKAAIKQTIAKGKDAGAVPSTGPGVSKLGKIAGTRVNKAAKSDALGLSRKRK